MEYPSLDSPTAGAIRFNTDTSTLDVYVGAEWQKILSTQPGQGGIDTYLSGGRAIMCGGVTSPEGNPSSSVTNVISYHTIATTGDFADFGDLTTSRTSISSDNCASRTRGLSVCGNISGSQNNTIEYNTIATLGNSIDFGDTNRNYENSRTCANQTRGVLLGGYSGVASINNISQITLSSLGNSCDFGTLTEINSGGMSASNAIRAIHAGGNNPSRCNTISYVNIQTGGFAFDFGDITHNPHSSGSGFSSTIRMCYAGGWNPAGSRINIVECVDFATTGNGQDFGDMSHDAASTQATSNCVRGLVMGGSSAGGRARVDMFEIATKGDSTDFGDLTQPQYTGCGFSNAHGGLG